MYEIVYVYEASNESVRELTVHGSQWLGNSLLAKLLAINTVLII